MIHKWHPKYVNIIRRSHPLAHSWSKAASAEGERSKRPATATQLFGSLVVTMLERSVKAGFRDFSRLIKDPAFEAFRYVYMTSSAFSST